MMETLFRDFFNEFWGGTDAHLDRDKDGNIVMIMDVPGFNESNLEMEITRNLIKVGGENDEGRKISKSVRLPFSPKDPKAFIKDGVLKVTFQTQEQLESNKVAIEQG